MAIAKFDTKDGQPVFVQLSERAATESAGGQKLVAKGGTAVLVARPAMASAPRWPSANVGGANVGDLVVVPGENIGTIENAGMVQTIPAPPPA